MLFIFLLLLTVSGVKGSGLILGTYVALMVAYYVLYAIGSWKMFAKAGIPGWHAFIPVLNEYDVFKMAWGSKWFWIYIVGTVAYACVPLDGGQLWDIVGWALAIAIAVIGIMCTYKLAKSFGKGVGYTIGLILIEPIIIMVLGFGKATYSGPQA